MNDLATPLRPFLSASVSPRLLVCFFFLISTASAKTPVSFPVLLDSGFFFLFALLSFLTSAKMFPVLLVSTEKPPPPTRLRFGNTRLKFFLQVLVLNEVDTSSLSYFAIIPI